MSPCPDDTTARHPGCQQEKQSVQRGAGRESSLQRSSHPTPQLVSPRHRPALQLPNPSPRAPHQRSAFDVLQPALPSVRSRRHRHTSRPRRSRPRIARWPHRMPGCTDGSHHWRRHTSTRRRHRPSTPPLWNRSRQLSPCPDDTAAHHPGCRQEKQCTSLSQRRRSAAAGSRTDLRCDGPRCAWRP